MNRTDNYNLKKPEGTDFYNVGDFNDNMDILDEVIADIQEQADGHYMKQLNSEVATSAWVASGNTEWPYKADITFTGCTADYICDVMFSAAQIAMWIFAPFAEAAAGKVTIFAEEIPESTLTIPAIELRK